MDSRILERFPKVTISTNNFSMVFKDAFVKRRGANCRTPMDLPGFQASRKKPLGVLFWGTLTCFC